MGKRMSAAEAPERLMTLAELSETARCPDRHLVRLALSG